MLDIREAHKEFGKIDWKKYKWLKEQKEKQLKEIENLRKDIELRQKTVRILNRQIGKELAK
jgi:uncharacterized protein YjaG (DUF416 family)